MRFSSKAATAIVSVSALAMANLPTALAAPAEQNFNGKESCITIDSQGNVRAPQPGDCTQFGKGGQGNSDAQARNVIFILGDGMGHQEITAARNYLKGANGRFEGLDELTASGAYTTFAVGRDGKRQYVTDSAASATGWSAGVKTYNGALSVDIEGKPHENLIEMAKNAGMRTGNVSTAEIQDATPAALGSHISQRGYYAPSGSKAVKGAEARQNGGLGSISEQLIDTRADVTLGGGRKYFNSPVQQGGENRNPFLTDKNDGGKDWEAGKSVRENAEAKGFRIVDDKQSLADVHEANQERPVLGLFNDGNMTRRFNKTVPGNAETQEPQVCEAQSTGDEPTAAEMTKKAIELLDDPTAEKGFFLQVESASIDKADHDSDACGMIGETEQIDEVIKEALDFAKKDKNTLIVVTADHAHTAEIVPDGEKSVSAVTRLRSPKDNGAVMSVGFGTLPWAEVDGKFQTGSMQHTGTQVRIAGYGPGSENVNGQIDQTDAFYVMANALGLNKGTKGGQDPWQVNKGNKVVSLANRREAKDGDQLCYLVTAGEAPKVGECAQFGTEGQQVDKAKAKNVVVLIGDGTGDSEITAARNYLKGSAGRFEGLDNLDYTGYQTTWALDKKTGLPNYVTDSAASGTGWNSGVKTYNGALGVDNAGKPVPTLGELAKANGKKIGNVTTAEIQDATPAAFAVHSRNRAYYAPSGDKKVVGTEDARENGGLGSISEQLVDLRADVTLGGGRKYFDAEVVKGGTWDQTNWVAGKSVLDNAKENGYQVVTTASELNDVKKADSTKPVLGLFSDGNMPRALEQSIPTTDGAVKDAATCVANPKFTDETPRLAAMTSKALELLDNENGFLLQVESASPDKADHQADACGLIGEVGQLDEAVKTVQDWVAKTGQPTLIVTTADHAHTAQITYNDTKTAGRTTKLRTADGSDMTINFATSKTNEDADALGGQEHTGSQVRIAASGPGAANITGQIDQTDIFFAVNNALGIDALNTNGAVDLDTKWQKPKQPQNGSSTGSSASSIILWILAGLTGLVSLFSIIALIFPFQVDALLGPIAGSSKR